MKTKLLKGLIVITTLLFANTGCNLNFKKTGDAIDSIAAKLMENKANKFFEAGRMDSAVTYYTISLTIYKNLLDSHDSARDSACYHEIAFITPKLDIAKYELKYHKNEMVFFSETLKQAEQLKKTGDLFYGDQKYDSSLQNYTPCYLLYKDLLLKGDSIIDTVYYGRISIVCSNMGWLNFHKKNFEESIDKYNEAVHFGKLAGQTVFYYSNENYLANAYYAHSSDIPGKSQSPVDKKEMMEKARYYYLASCKGFDSLKLKDNIHADDAFKDASKFFGETKDTTNAGIYARKISKTLTGETSTSAVIHNGIQTTTTTVNGVVVKTETKKVN